jgi:hypothetical protein
MSLKSAENACFSLVKITVFIPAGLGHNSKFSIRTTIVFQYDVTTFVVYTHFTPHLLE